MKTTRNEEKSLILFFLKVMREQKGRIIFNVRPDSELIEFPYFPRYSWFGRTLLVTVYESEVEWKKSAYDRARKIFCWLLKRNRRRSRA